jgi:glycosyltransferase involved in cell wall biosynthesis
MRILHLNTERTWRGGEQQCLYLLEGLKAHDIACHLVCPPDSPLEERAEKSGIPVFPVTMRGETDLSAVFQIRRLIRKGRYHIVHSHTSHAHTLAFLASAGIPTIRLVTRRVDFSIFRHSFLHLSGMKYRYMADFYIAISHEIKRVLVNDGLAPHRIFVVHSGVDLDRFLGISADHLKEEFSIGHEEKIVLNVAHLAGHKGQKYLVEAIPRILREVPLVRFFIVGGGQLRSELIQRTDSLGLKDKIVFTGFRKDVGAFYNLADLFVMSSVKEGLGTAVLDALALGLPVVATKAGGIPESVLHDRTGRLVPPGDSAALAKEVIYMLKQPNEALRMGRQGQVFAREHFSIQAMIERNIDVYHQISGRRPGNCIQAEEHGIPCSNT